MPRPAFSLRRTLAVRFAFTMFAALLALALWAYLGARHTLMQQLDQSLRGSAQLQVNTLMGLPIGAESAQLPADCFVRDINLFVAVRDSTGRVLGSNSARGRDLPLHQVAFEQSRRTGSRLITYEWRGRNYRSIYLATPSTSSRPAVVQVSASLVPLEKSLEIILMQMMATVLLGTLATAVGAGWLADSAVAPVSEITEQARAITGAAPGQRITAHVTVSEFHGLTEVVNAMLARLEQASHWHRRIIRDLGHDLRTPVTAMRAGVEVALWHDRSPEDYRRILASTMEEIDRLNLICDALVFLGRLQAGEVKLDLVTMDARLLAREAVAGAQETGGARSIALVQPSEPVPILADTRLMRMILDQLLDNARRYTPPDSRIEVAVRTENEEAVITVEDNGDGVSDEVLPHLFEPFYRSDTARAREGGPGLGLTATAAIISLHGGAVAASRGSEGGLRVEVRLPSVQASLLAGTPGILELAQRSGVASARAVTSG